MNRPIGSATKMAFLERSPKGNSNYRGMEMQYRRCYPSSWMISRFSLERAVGKSGLAWRQTEQTGAKGYWQGTGEKESGGKTEHGWGKGSCRRTLCLKPFMAEAIIYANDGSGAAVVVRG